MIVHKKGFPLSRRTTYRKSFFALSCSIENTVFRYSMKVMFPIRVKSPSGKDALWEGEPGILVFAGSVFFQKFIDSLVWI